MTKKPSKRKKKERAAWEIGVVRECRDGYDDKIESMRRRVSDEQCKLGTLTEKIKATEDMAVCKQLYEYVEGYRADIELSQEMLGQLCKNREMLTLLLNLLEKYFTHGQYDYIIRKIPERTLPKLIKSGEANKLGKVYDLVCKLYAGLYAQLGSFGEALRMTEEELRSLRETHEAVRAAQQSSLRDDEIARAVEEIKRGTPAGKERRPEGNDHVAT